MWMLRWRASDTLVQEDESYYCVLSDSQRENPQPGKGLRGKETEEKLHRLVNTRESRREEKTMRKPVERTLEGKASHLRILLSDKEN